MPVEITLSEEGGLTVLTAPVFLHQYIPDRVSPQTCCTWLVLEVFLLSLHLRAAASGMSVLWLMKPKPLGKVRRRVQDLRISSSSSCCLLLDRPVLDLSHNESARLAVDCLLGQGLTEYHAALKTEGEVDFLSEPEKNYILENRRDGNTVASAPEDEGEEEGFSAGCQFSSLSSMMSTDSSSTVEELDSLSPEDMKPTDPDCHKSTEIFLSRAAGMKDLVRQFISKAEQTLVVVTDSFSDTELLCDLLEASRKRNVSVYLLLDHLNLDLFISTWKGHQLNSKDFPKLSVRSVQGQTYCSKTGKKLTGQIAESFILVDWAEVLTGSYSFTWLSWQVHRSLAVLLRGSHIRPFHQEFHRLYSISEPLAGFVTFLPAPLTPPLHSSTAAQNIAISKQRSNQTKTVHHWEGNGVSRQAWTNSTTTFFTGSHGEEGDNPPPLLQNCLAEPEAESKRQTPSVEEPQDTAASDQTSSDFVPHLISSSISPAADKNKWIEESNTLHSASKTHPLGFHAFKHSGLAEVLNTQQGHWNKSNFPLKVEVPPENSNFYPALKANPILQSAFSSSRGPATGLLSSQPNTDFSFQQRARMVSHLRTQPQAEFKLYLPGSSAKTPLQTHMYQRVNQQRSYWAQQNYRSAGPRSVVRQQAFSGTHMAGQLVWRPLQRTVNASLERSKSINEKGVPGL